MKEVGFMKKATGVIAAAVAVLTVMPTSEVHAQTSNTIFPEGWDKSVRNRMFMRLGAITVNTKTEATDAADVTGFIFGESERQLIVSYLAVPANVTAFQTANPGFFTNGAPGYSGFSANAWRNTVMGGAITTTPEFQNNGGIGIPAGIRAKVGESSTVALSMGYWLTDDFSWALEAFLLAKPLDVKVYGKGTNAKNLPNGLDGKHILSTKMLPPLAIVSRHFGSPRNIIRPFVGIGATYAVLYDAKVTNAFEQYAGGKTSVSIKNAFGVGPFVGLSSPIGERWNVNVQVGQIKLKTEALLTTRNTNIVDGMRVLDDYSTEVMDPDGVSGAFQLHPQIVQNTMKLLIAARNARDGTNNNDLGSYTRKQKQELRNTIVNVSVGYSF